MIALIAGLLLAAGLAVPQEFAGNEMCQACHEDIAKAFLKSSPHRVLEGNSCESCHGAGAKHAESADAKLIRNPRKLTPAQVDKGCLACHAKLPSQHGRVMTGHGRQQVGCTSCHSIHTEAPKPECGSCHLAQKTSFAKPHSHPLRQGAMNCQDCHSPHGTPLARSVSLAVGTEQGCLKCHGDKRGPFTYEHVPVRMEGCASCHEPHGSANPRMLTRPSVQQLCLECHSAVGTAAGGIPPAFHDLRSARYRSCTTCHVKIHGSHVSKALLR